MIERLKQVLADGPLPIREIKCRLKDEHPADIEADIIAGIRRGELLLTTEGVALVKPGDFTVAKTKINPV